jgi:hypothetical protein
LRVATLLVAAQDINREAGMIARVWTTVQGLVEYGALTGSAAGSTAGGASGIARLTGWAADHRIALIAAVAGLSLLWMVLSSRKR